MNTPSSPVTARALQVTRFARENPTRSLLVAIGFGLAVGLLVRALQPRPSESRAARLLADMAESGVGTIRNGAAHLHDLHLDRGLRKLGRRFKNLFR